MPTIPNGLQPVVESYGIGAPGGVERTEVDGGAPRSALAYDRGVQQFRVTMIVSSLRFSVWTTFFHHTIKKGALSFDMPLDSGYGMSTHAVTIEPGTYSATPTGGGEHTVWTISFMVSAESMAYEMSASEAEDLLDLYDEYGDYSSALLQGIDLFANQHTLVFA